MSGILTPLDHLRRSFESLVENFTIEMQKAVKESTTPVSKWMSREENINLNQGFLLEQEKLGIMLNLKVTFLNFSKMQELQSKIT